METIGLINWMFKDKKNNRADIKPLNAETIEECCLDRLSITDYLKLKKECESDVIQSCIDTLARHSAKAMVQLFKKTNNKLKEVDPKLEKLLNYRPNPNMNGIDYLKKIRTDYEYYGNAFVLIDREDDGSVKALYPISFHSFKIILIETRPMDTIAGFIFYQKNGKELRVVIDDLIWLVRSYGKDPYAGIKNGQIMQVANTLNTVDAGLVKAIELTTGFRGFIKHTRSQLKDKTLKQIQDEFVENYIKDTENTGIASMDATMEYIPVKSDPLVIESEQYDRLMERIIRFFGMNKNILESKFSEAEWIAFYESEIEPFLMALSIETCLKVYGIKKIMQGYQVQYSANKLLYASNETLSQLIQMFDRGMITGNDVAMAKGLPAYEGGDVRYIRGEYIEKGSGDIDNKR